MRERGLSPPIAIKIFVVFMRPGKHLIEKKSKLHKNNVYKYAAGLIVFTILLLINVAIVGHLLMSDLLLGLFAIPLIAFWLSMCAAFFRKVFYNYYQLKEISKHGNTVPV
jgi:hypothetical protein